MVPGTEGWKHPCPNRRRLGVPVHNDVDYKGFIGIDGMVKDIFEVTRLFNLCTICSAGLRQSGKIGIIKLPCFILF